VRPQLNQKIADKLVECIVKEIELGNTLLSYEIDPLANENICPSLLHTQIIKTPENYRQY
jgi:hypothetical protein